MIGTDYMIACAPNVAPETTGQIIQVESRGNPLAINVNGARLTTRPTDRASAARIARDYIAKGYSVDLGLMQVNNRNLEKLGYSIEDMFEPCKNIAAGTRVLSSFYSSALKKNSDPQLALRAALSAYNTGSFERGFSNGYVARYGLAAMQPPARIPLINLYSADTAVFIRSLQKQKEDAMAAEENLSSGQPTASRIQTIPIVSRSAADAQTPGVKIEHSPADADALGAFAETALDHHAAWIANEELDPNSTGIVVHGKIVRDETSVNGGVR